MINFHIESEPVIGNSLSTFSNNRFGFIHEFHTAAFSFRYIRQKMVVEVMPTTTKPTPTKAG